MFHLDETQRHSSLTKRNFSLFHHHRSHYHYCHHSLILAKFSNLFSSIHFTSFNLSFSSINIFFHLLSCLPFYSIRPFIHLFYNKKVVSFLCVWHKAAFGRFIVIASDFYRFHLFHPVIINFISSPYTHIV